MIHDLFINQLRLFSISLCVQTNMAVNSQPRSITPEGQQDYDVTRMREEDFERLAVYIVPDVPCERGTAGRAEKTLPRSLTLKPSLVLSTPNVKVRRTVPFVLTLLDLSINSPIS